MKCEGKRCVSLVTAIIAVIILVQTNFLTIMIMTTIKDNKQEKVVAVSEQEKNTSYEKTKEEWKLVIPKIKVSADIKEGTDGEVINNYIGHFKETPDENGNIGLIAASAGYKENYFSNLKELQEGDVILYTKGDTKKEYTVTTNNVIEETDWSYLSNTQDNRLTLITGVLEEPEKRLCVQAIEIN